MTAAEGSTGRPGAGEMVRMLEAALAPVDPPARLGDELERRLARVQSAAMDELVEWELAAMRDPRNWVRPAAAVAVGTAAGAALVLVRMRRSQRHRSRLRGIAGQGRDLVDGAIGSARARIR